jgi:hypothetical protein
MASSIENGLLPLVSRSYAKYAVSVLITFLRNLVTQLTGNPSFPTPNPTLVVVTDAVDDLDAKTQAAMNGGRVERAARRASRAAALSLARQLGNYVESQSNGSLESLLSSGFNAVRAASPPRVPLTPGNPRLAYTDVSGQLMFRFIGDNNARNFSVQHAENPEGPWTDVGLHTSTRVPIPGLTPGNVYYSRARAHGAAGSSDWCTPVSKMAV